MSFLSGKGIISSIMAEKRLLWAAILIWGVCMKYGLYTVKDIVAQDAGPVFCAVNDGVAIRQFKVLVKDSGAPDDYELYSLGAYDSETLELQGLPGIEACKIDIPEEVKK